MNIIYKITNSINEKVYIGQTWRSLQRRFYEHKKPSQKLCIKLHNAFNKHGRDNFQIVKIASCKTQEMADLLEYHFIKKYNSIMNGYNIKTGGSIGRHSEESKKKMSIARKGKPTPWMNNRIVSEDTRKKQSKNRLGKKQSKETIDKKVIGRKGYKHSEETIKKISEFNKKNNHKGQTWKLINGKRVWLEKVG